MENNDCNKNAERKIVIKTPQGEVRITGKPRQNPGICPHCRKPIPLSAIVFKKEGKSGTETYSGIEMAKKYGVTIGEDSMLHGDRKQDRIGECPYCHKLIPVREIAFAKTGEQ